MAAEATAPPATDRLIEVVARALAQHRLGVSEFSPSGVLSAHATSILEKAAERLWPQLVEESRVVATALRAEGLTAAAADDRSAPPPGQAAAAAE
jgi:hypothetical protein